MFEKVFVHKGVIRLFVVLAEADVFIKVECSDMREVEAFVFVHSDEFFI